METDWRPLVFPFWSCSQRESNHLAFSLAREKAASFLLTTDLLEVESRESLPVTNLTARASYFPPSPPAPFTPPHNLQPFERNDCGRKTRRYRTVAA